MASILFYFLLAFSIRDINILSASGSWAGELRLMAGIVFCICFAFDYIGIRDKFQ